MIRIAREEKDNKAYLRRESESSLSNGYLNQADEISLISIHEKGGNYIDKSTTATNINKQKNSSKSNNIVDNVEIEEDCHELNIKICSKSYQSEVCLEEKDNHISTEDQIIELNKKNSSVSNHDDVSGMEEKVDHVGTENKGIDSNKKNSSVSYHDDVSGMEEKIDHVGTEDKGIDFNKKNSSVSYHDDVSGME